MTALRPLQVLRRVALVVLLTRGLSAEEPRARPDQSVADLLRGQPTSPSSASRPVASSPGEAALKLGGWAALALGAAALVVLLRRRRRISPDLCSGGLAVEGRLALSHKHAVCLLRSGDRHILVGLTPEGMTQLDCWEAGAAAGPEEAGPGGTEKGPTESAERRGGFTIRPQDREAMSAARSYRDTDLLAYRPQVERLRGHLRSLRSESLEEPGTEETKA